MIMDTGIISRRYAETLLLYARRHGLVDRIYDDALTLVNGFEQYPVFKRIMTNKTVMPDKKMEVVNLVTNGRIASELDNFIRLVITNKREKHLQFILLHFRELVRCDKNIIDVKVVTAIPVDDATVHRIAKSGTNTESMNIHAKVDPSIIGGYIIEWDNYRFDSSIRSKLQAVRNGLAEN